MTRLVISSWVLTLLLGAAPVYSQAPKCLTVGRAQLAEALGAPELTKWLTLEAATCNELVMGRDGVGFKLGEDTLPVYGGNRTEVAIDFPFNEGDTVRYSWQMKLPTDFVGDPLNRWWLLAQWHDQPDRRLGETWAGFASRSPPVAIYTEQRNGIVGIGLIFNGHDKRSWVKVPLGEWLVISITIHWSTQGDGEVTFDIVGYPEFPFKTKGKTMHNAYQHYLKFGQYRHKSNRIESTVFFRDLDIENLTRIEKKP